MTDREVDEVGLRGQYRNGEWRRESEDATVISEFLGLDSFASESSESKRKRKSVSVLIPKEALEAVVCFKATKPHHAFQIWISVIGCLCSATDPPLIQLPAITKNREKKKKSFFGPSLFSPYSPKAQSGFRWPKLYKPKMWGGPDSRLEKMKVTKQQPSYIIRGTCVRRAELLVAHFSFTKREIQVLWSPPHHHSSLSLTFNTSYPQGKVPTPFFSFSNCTTSSLFITPLFLSL